MIGSLRVKILKKFIFHDLLAFAYFTFSGILIVVYLAINVKSKFDAELKLTQNILQLYDGSVFNYAWSFLFDLELILTAIIAGFILYYFILKLGQIDGSAIRILSSTFGLIFILVAPHVHILVVLFLNREIEGIFYRPDGNWWIPYYAIFILIIVLRAHHVKSESNGITESVLTNYILLFKEKMPTFINYYFVISLLYNSRSISFMMNREITYINLGYPETISLHIGIFWLSVLIFSINTLMNVFLFINNGFLDLEGLKNPELFIPESVAEGKSIKKHSISVFLILSIVFAIIYKVQQINYNHYDFILTHFKDPLFRADENSLVPNWDALMGGIYMGVIFFL